ncbi:MAG: alpha-N-arabinofuranosidase [Phycisphaeraceae bacterium]|nr:MAG: alpha-N-arabinofuranosidase [Phycisphaeraceae bacterium]
MISDNHALLPRLVFSVVLCLFAVVAFAQGTISVSGASGWRQNTWAGGGDMMRTGAGAATEFQIASRGGADIGWSTQVAVEPGAIYRLSGKIRTQDLDRGTGRGALLSAQGVSGGQTVAISGTTDWTEVDAIFRSGGRESITFICLFGGWGQSTGQAWYKDIRLEKVDLGNVKPSVAIDAGATRPEMSELIYSQFIEHMGRCINGGGIWAEMLQDRKFYYPITADYHPYSHYRDTDYPAIAASPWEIVGPKDAVVMETADPFVGDHTPRVKDGGAIRQHDLGVVKGREYTGYIWVRALSGSPVVDLALDSAAGPVSVSGMGDGYGKHTFTFAATASNGKAALTVSVRGGEALIGTLSLMPADNVDGMRADVVGLLEQLDAPMYRWPGGNFVSGYDWRDGIGDRDRRPPRTNPAWTGIEPNDFGMHEFIHLCRILDTEPLITMNMGFEGAFSAEAEMEYANGTDGYWAQQRAVNGSSEPFGVKYWAIGNEMWGDWQLGFMSPEDYQIKNNWVVERLRKRFPGFIALASGNTGDWSRGLLEHCSNDMDMIAEHFYDQHRDDVAEHVQLVPESIRQKAQWHRATQDGMASLHGKRIPIAMTEWNYWYGPYKYGELGTVYFLRDALGIAAGLNEYSRCTDIIGAAFYAQTVNVIGAIKTTKTDAFLAATALPLIMYHNHFGTIPVEAEMAHADLLGFDVAAAWNDDRSALTIAVVNASGHEATIGLGVAGAKLSGPAHVWRFSGNDPDMYNDANAARLKIEDAGEVEVRDSVTVPAYSASIYVVPAER